MQTSLQPSAGAQGTTSSSWHRCRAAQHAGHAYGGVRTAQRTDAGARGCPGALQVYFASKQHRRALQLLRRGEFISSDVRFKYLAAQCLLECKQYEECLTLLGEEASEDERSDPKPQDVSSPSLQPQGRTQCKRPAHRSPQRALHQAVGRSYILKPYQGCALTLLVTRCACRSWVGKSLGQLVCACSERGRMRR